MSEADVREQRRRGRPRSEAARLAILEAAGELLLTNGLEAVSMDAVAERAGVSKATIYRWWPSKAALLLEVYQRGKRVDTPDTGNLEEDLVGFLKNLFSHWRQTSSGSVFRSLVAEAQSDPAAAAALADYARGRRAHTGQMIERAKARGEVAADVNAELVADLIASFAWTHLLTDRLDEDEATIRAAVRYVMHGIAPGAR